jgi:hypothetical protein
MDGRSDRDAAEPPARRRSDAQGVDAALKLSKTPKLAALGVALGLVIAAVVVKMAPRAAVPQMNATPAGLAGEVLVEDDGALSEVLFQYTAAQEEIVAPTYIDFLRALDPTTQLVAVVPRDADAGTSDAAALQAFLARVDPSGGLAKRTRVVETTGPITVWSKDRALVLAAPRTQLVVPMRPDPSWRERYNDWSTLASVAKAMPERYLVNEVPLEYDAGDFAVTGDKIVVDVNLVAKNQKHGLTTARALSEFLARTFHRTIVMLGDAEGDVPRHHLSMYMAPLADGTMLVGDPRAGRDLVGPTFTPGEESPDTGEPLVADFSDATLAKFDRAAKDLAAAGFRVERVPVVPFDDKTYVTYTNGVYERRGARKIAYVPQYARDEADTRVTRMDALAVATYRRLGWEVRPVRVRDAYRFHGTVGCLTNVLRRERTP